MNLRETLCMYTPIFHFIFDHIVGNYICVLKYILQLLSSCIKKLDLFYGLFKFNEPLNYI